MNFRRLAIGWVVAVLIALAFSWSAVAQVRNRVIEPAVAIPTTVTTQPAPTTTPQVIRLDLDEPVVTSLADASTTTSTTAAPSPPPSTTAPTATEETAGTTTSTTTTTSPPLVTSTTTTTTTTSPPPTTTTQPQLATSSHTMVGGVVTISHIPGTVNFVSAIPQPGFTTEQREAGPIEVRIRFESETHTSDFRARWDDGELEITINETDDDDD